MTEYPITDMITLTTVLPIRIVDKSLVGVASASSILLAAFGWLRLMRPRWSVSSEKSEVSSIEKNAEQQKSPISATSSMMKIVSMCIIMHAA